MDTPRHAAPSVSQHTAVHNMTPAVATVANKFSTAKVAGKLVELQLFPRQRQQSKSMNKMRRVVVAAVVGKQVEHQLFLRQSPQFKSMSKMRRVVVAAVAQWRWP